MATSPAFGPFPPRTSPFRNCTLFWPQRSRARYILHATKLVACFPYSPLRPQHSRARRRLVSRLGADAARTAPAQLVPAAADVHLGHALKANRTRPAALPSSSSPAPCRARHPWLCSAVALRLACARGGSRTCDPRCLSLLLQLLQLLQLFRRRQLLHLLLQHWPLLLLQLQGLAIAATMSAWRQFLGRMIQQRQRPEEALQ